MFDSVLETPQNFENYIFNLQNLIVHAMIVFRFIHTSSNYDVIQREQSKAWKIVV